MLGDNNQRTSYTGPVVAIGSRFETSKRKELFWFFLQSSSRQRVETFPGLAQAEFVLGLVFFHQYGCQLLLKDGFYELQFGDTSETKTDKPVKAPPVERDSGRPPSPST